MITEPGGYKSFGERGSSRDGSMSALIVASCVAIYFSPGSTASDSFYGCETPAASGLPAVEQMLENPPKLPLPDLPSDVNSPQNYPAALLNRAINAEEQRLGLTFAKIDAQKATAAAEAAYGNPGVEPFSDYLKLGQSVLSQYGITLRLSPAHDGAITVHTPTSQELETVQAKSLVMDLVSFFASQPKQLIEAAPALKEVDLTAHGTLEDFGPFAGEADIADGKMLLDVTNDADLSHQTNTTPHEFVHFLDIAECGSLDNALHDPEYSDLNQHATYAGHWPLPSKYLKSEPPVFYPMMKKYNSLVLQESQAEIDNDQITEHGATEQISALIGHTEMQTVYSYTDPMEDKAEMGTSMFYPGDYSESTDPRSPVRRKKFLTEMTRLMLHAPNVFRYYMMMYGLMRQLNEEPLK